MIIKKRNKLKKARKKKKIILLFKKNNFYLSKINKCIVPNKFKVMNKIWKTKNNINNKILIAAQILRKKIKIYIKNNLMNWILKLVHRMLNI